MVFLDVQKANHEPKSQAQCAGSTPLQPAPWQGDAALRSQVDELRRELLWVRRVHEDEKEEWLRQRGGMQQVIDNQREKLNAHEELTSKQKDEIGGLHTVLERLAETDAGRLREEYDQREAWLKSECRKRLRQRRAEAEAAQQAAAAEMERLRRINAELQRQLVVQRELNETANGLQGECDHLVRRVVELTEGNWRQEQTIQELEDKLAAAGLAADGESPLFRQNSPDSGFFDMPAAWKARQAASCPAADVKHTTQSVLGHSLRQAMSQQREMQELKLEVERLLAENTQLRCELGAPRGPPPEDRSTAA